ncbi:VENN motif pre-toxin domain-containing protein [Acinetobacter soli]|nr:VENN motif pre-toxin domain-containing protein [Acinetobacter soli]WEI11749.1 VENN motif pre-toxin domain-containing protein [Acinetobacter soli]WEI15787.1 VENN motif pre-toxin domain-containing protein [Acinetobacter soli]
MIPEGKTTLDLTDDERTSIINTSKLVAGTTAAFAGYDVNTAANSANTAVENNSLGKLVTTAGKAAYKVARKISEMPASVRANLKPSEIAEMLRKEGVQGIIDIGDNIATLVSPSSSMGDRAFALIDIAIGIDLKAAKNVDALKVDKNIIGKNYSIGLNRQFLNKVGDFYPNVPDLRTGKTISFPIGDLKKYHRQVVLHRELKNVESLFRNGIRGDMKLLVGDGLNMIFIILNHESLEEQMNFGI